MYPLDIYSTPIYDATRTHPHMAKCGMCEDPADRSPKLPRRFECRAEFCNEEFRRGEMAALINVVVINEFGIRALRPILRGCVAGFSVRSNVGPCHPVESSVSKSFGFYITRPDRVRKCSRGLGIMLEARHSRSFFSQAQDD